MIANFQTKTKKHEKSTQMLLKKKTNTSKLKV